VPVIITGSSDDLIEIDGDLSEEFYSPDGGRSEGDLLACSDGTVLRISYTQDGIWRITPVVQGSAILTIEQAPEDDEDHYTDTATLDGPVRWVVCGTQIAK
jgi:hypothetical protein